MPNAKVTKNFSIRFCYSHFFRLNALSLASFLSNFCSEHVQDDLGCSLELELDARILLGLEL